MKLEPTSLDRAIEWLSPAWAAKRLSHRARLELAKAYYDGASTGRRTASIRRSGADVNLITQSALPNLRKHARDLVRNNPHAKRGIEATVSNTVSTGASPYYMRGKDRAEDLQDLATEHLEGTQCDADERLTYRGIQELAFRTTVEAGEVLIRRRWRRPSDGYAVPVQFQVLEPEYLDTSIDGPQSRGGYAIQGVEYDAIGRRRAYHLYTEHPGGRRGGFVSKPVPAADIIHIYRMDRPGQVRGIPWLAPVILRLADFADYEEAHLVRQKIAACFAVFITEPYDNGVPGTTRETEDGSLIDSLEPGIVERLTAGQEVSFAAPPGVDGYGEYANVSLHAIAAGLGISYEALTGDLRGVNFSSGKMGRLEMMRNINSWQKNILVSQLCAPFMRWWLEAVALIGIDVESVRVKHVTPRHDMIDPVREWKARRDAVRSGQTTLSQLILAEGRDPREHFEEYGRDLDLLDELHIVLDSDPRTRTASGGAVTSTTSGSGEPDESDLDDLVDSLLQRNGAHG